MVLKLFGQLVVLGSKVIFGSIRETFKQVTQTAAKNASQPTVKAPSNMALDEAYKILNVTKEVKPDELQSKFETMFKANDRKGGGSFYLQSKIVRALERIELERGSQ